MDLGLFTILSKDDKPKKASEMAHAAGADSKLVCMPGLPFDAEVELTLMLARILKHLCAVGVILETGPNEYRRTGLSISLMSQRYSDAYPCM